MVGFDTGRFTNQDGVKTIAEIHGRVHRGRKRMPGDENVEMPLGSECGSRLQTVRKGLHDSRSAAAIEAQIHDNTLDRA